MDNSYLISGGQSRHYRVDNQPVSFTEDYSVGGNTHRQYVKGSGLQWRVDDPELFDWSVPFDFTKPVMPDELNIFYGTRYWDDVTKNDGDLERLRRDLLAEQMWQYLHGEQGALKVTAQIAAGIENCNDQLAAGLQVGDEARHVEFFRHITHRIEKTFTVNPKLQELIDHAMTDSREHFKFMAMQILIEGLALAAFGTSRKGLVHAAAAGGGDATLYNGLQYIIRDEARHVSFGILSLRQILAQLPENELRESADFIYDGFRMMRERFAPKFVCEERGYDPKKIVAELSQSVGMKSYHNALIKGILPQVLALGLVPDNYRDKYTQEFGVDWARVRIVADKMEKDL